MNTNMDMYATGIMCVCVGGWVNEEETERKKGKMKRAWGVLFHALSVRWRASAAGMYLWYGLM
jgi:hypothetical protein